MSVLMYSDIATIMPIMGAKKNKSQESVKDSIIDTMVAKTPKIIAKIIPMI